MVGVVAHQRREVEGDRQTGLTVLEQELVPLVGIGRAAEAGELPHRPELAAIHRRMNAAREGILAGAPELAFRVEAIEIGGAVDRFLLDGHLPFLSCSRTSAATSYGLRVPAATSSSRRASRSSARVSSHTHWRIARFTTARVRAARRRFRRSSSLPLVVRYSWWPSSASTKPAIPSPLEATVVITGASQESAVAAASPRRPPPPFAALGWWCGVMCANALPLRIPSMTSTSCFSFSAPGRSLLLIT